ncbi:MAG: pyridoxal kinase [Pseudomonadota bacterium]
MARILAISSQVASGHVGLSAVVPALHALGHEVIALPTIVLSNHPAHPHVSGTRVAPDVLGGMVSALANNGFLNGVDAVLSGYLPTAAHAEFVRDTVSQLRFQRSDLPYICDPVLGDEPKGLYIDSSAATAVRDALVPIATMIVPNAFELGWLSGQSIKSPNDAALAARALAPDICIATSVPQDENCLANVAIHKSGPPEIVSVSQLRAVPKGTGDLLSGLLAAGLALRDAVALVEETIALSLGKPELALVEATARWRRDDLRRGG